MIGAASRGSKRDLRQKQLIEDGNRGKRNLRKISNTDGLKNSSHGDTLHSIYMDPKVRQKQN